MFMPEVCRLPLQCSWWPARPRPAAGSGGDQRLGQVVAQDRQGGNDRLGKRYRALGLEPPNPPPVRPWSARLGAPVCADATSLAERFMSINELHERIYTPFGSW
jgi:hypothetical protein